MKLEDYPTPLTDAEPGACDQFGPKDAVHINFARNLEQQLARAFDHLRVQIEMFETLERKSNADLAELAAIRAEH